jgi:NADP-dependent 3-hydroxy acid dehydrogenase YdfG
MDNRTRNHSAGRTAVVTGAASGIGRELALQLAAAGARVHALDIDGPRLATLSEASGIAITTAELDVADAEACARVFGGIIDATDGIDFLFNNAGITLLGKSHAIPFAQTRRLLEINLLGVIHGIQFVYPEMLRRRSGHIINTASVAGAGGYATAAAYAASKSAVIELTRSLRAEARTHGVRVSAACPGYVDSAIFATDRIHGADREKVIHDMPVKMLKPEDAARMLLKGVARHHNPIVFPVSAKVLWFLANWFPAAIRPFQRSFIKTFDH